MPEEHVVEGTRRKFLKAAVTAAGAAANPDFVDAQRPGQDPTLWDDYLERA
jgi:hypothetical protein